MNTDNPTGHVVYQGRSLIGNGEPIVAIITWHSSNRKTGDMVQLWILPAHLDPLAAVQANDNHGACGSCPLQGVFNASIGRIQGRICYVNLGQAPLSIFKAWRRGAYPTYNHRTDKRRLHGRRLRLGAYGDPAALPVRLLRQLTSAADGWTGYTHQLAGMPRRRADAVASMCMASTSTDAERRRWQARGYRTFHVLGAGESVPDNDVMCPNTTHGVKCDRCGLCPGSSVHAKSIVIGGHGVGAVNL